MTAALARPAGPLARPATALARPAAAPRLRPAPRREPPFDDEVDATVVIGPLDQPLPFYEWRPLRRPLTKLPTLPRRTVPEPALWGRRLLVGIIETAAGKRPLHQLSALLSPGVAHRFGADLTRVAAAGGRHWTHAATIGTIRVDEPARDVAELAATLRVAGRVRAVALRLELRAGRWCCTRLVLG